MRNPIFPSSLVLTMRVLVAIALALASADAATRVAVIELGKTGSVRRTTASNEETSADGVASFWSSLHGYGRKLQHAGMTVVPDLFHRPESGVVVGLTGVDLDEMPNLNTIMTSEQELGVVGHMEVHGQQCKNMLRKVKDVEQIKFDDLDSAFERQAANAGLSGMKLSVTTEKANDVDMQLTMLIQKASEQAESTGKTVVLHIVVEEDEGASRRRRLARRLEEAEGEGEGEGEKEGEEGEGEKEEGEGEEDKDNEENDGYYGYGYYNEYGEWVTPYKSMFQIQYFNVVLWTSIGLVSTLFFSLYLFVYMPLMADTLLFGESAKVAHDD